jgi:hypothetical protein
MEIFDLESVTAEELTRQSLTALRAGDKLQAYELLTEALSIDPQDSEAWLWISTVVATKNERRYCLEQALRFDPANETAQHGLSLLPDVLPQAPAFAAESQPDAAADAPVQPQPAPVVEPEQQQTAVPRRPALTTSQMYFAPVATLNPVHLIHAVPPASSAPAVADMPVMSEERQQSMPRWMSMAIVVLATLLVVGAVGMAAMVLV